MVFNGILQFHIDLLKLGVLTFSQGWLCSIIPRSCFIGYSFGGKYIDISFLATDSRILLALNSEIHSNDCSDFRIPCTSQAR